MTTTTLTSRRAEAAGTGRPRLLGRAVGVEWTKLRSVRSTYGSLAAAVVVTVGIAALAAWAITTDDQPNPATVTQLAAVGASVGQFGLVALAALAITGEFATGSIRTTLAATPARSAVLTAKAVVVGAVTFAGLVATALATLAASAILGVGADGILAVSARSAAALTLTSLLVALRPRGGGPAARRLGRRGPGRRDLCPASPRPLIMRRQALDSRRPERTSGEGVHL